MAAGLASPVLPEGEGRAAEQWIGGSLIPPAARHTAFPPSGVTSPPHPGGSLVIPVPEVPPIRSMRRCRNDCFGLSRPTGRCGPGWRRFGRTRRFPRAIQRRPKQEAEGPPRLPETDLTDVPFVTLDPAGSLDLDQAIHLERTPSGFLLRYAVADVAAFVTPGGALDKETRIRAVTLYAPDKRTPLHPFSLSEGNGSLLAGQDRPAVVWEIAFDPRWRDEERRRCGGLWCAAGLNSNIDPSRRISRPVNCRSRWLPWPNWADSGSSERRPGGASRSRRRSSRWCRPMVGGGWNSARCPMWNGGTHSYRWRPVWRRGG